MTHITIEDSEETVLRDLVEIVEGLRCPMEHGVWRDQKGMRLKDTKEWVAFAALKGEG